MRLKQTSENLETQKKLKFFFGCRGPLVIMFGGMEAGGPDWDGGSGCRRGNGREPDGTGSWGQECQMVGRKGMAGGRRTRWQLLGVVGQEGQMAGGGAGG